MTKCTEANLYFEANFKIAATADVKALIIVGKSRLKIEDCQSCAVLYFNAADVRQSGAADSMKIHEPSYLSYRQNCLLN